MAHANGVKHNVEMLRSKNL